VFGEVVDGEMRVNAAGKMVANWLLELENKFPGTTIDEYVVMPNHLHGIIILQDDVGADLRVCPNQEQRKDAEAEPHACPRGIVSGESDGDRAGAHAGAPLPRIVQWFKTMTTNEYMRHVASDGWPPFAGRLWQRNYHDRIIRDERELHARQRYIGLNPARWAEDEENLARARIHAANTRVPDPCR
jgi:REP element-mobilizing transposase RayT